MPPSPSGSSGGEQGRDGAAMEQPALDRGALAARPARSRSRRSMRAARSAWIVAGTVSSPVVGIVGEHGEHLLDEERVALGRLDDALPETRRDGEVADQSLDELARTRRSLSGESGTRRGARPGRRPGRARSRRASGRARQRSRIAAPPENAERRTRAGRAASARPSGCRRSRRRAGAARRASRRSGGTPRRSPPVSRAAAGADRIQDQPGGHRASLDVRQQLGERRSGSAPATPRTISASGRYVIPSP